MKVLLLLILLTCTQGVAGPIEIPLIKSWLAAGNGERKLPPIDDPLRNAMLVEVHQALTNRPLVLQHGGRLDLLATWG